MTDFNTKSFKSATFGWQDAALDELEVKVQRAKVWQRWPEQQQLVWKMENRLRVLRNETNSLSQSDALLARFGTQRDGHAIFAPSGSAEWLNCAGSLIAGLEAGDTAGIDAAMGTVAHRIAEEWNKTGREPRHLLGTTQTAVAGGKLYEFEIDEEWLDNARMFVEWCASLPGDHYFEQKVDISFFTPIPDQRGTADHFACEPGVLTITDLKNGKVRVYAKNNSQALCYAAGAFMQWDWVYGFQRIVIRICHPRLDIFDVWEITREELLAFIAESRPKALAAWAYNAPRTPGEKQCRYCNARFDCTAREIAMEDGLDEIFESSDPAPDYLVFNRSVSRQESEKRAMLVADRGPAVADLKAVDASRLSTIALERLLKRRKEIERFLKDVYEEVLKRADNGENLVLHKIGQGRQRHEWKNPKRAVQLLAFNFEVPDDAFYEPRKLLSIDKTRKMLRAVHKSLKPKPINDLLDRHGLVNSFAGKHGLISVEDERESIDDLMDDTFDTDD